MGWNHDDTTHEGYLVAIVTDTGGHFLGAMTGRAAELGSPDDCTFNVRAVFVRRAKAACSCGWRSPLLVAPNGTSWSPSTVDAPRWFEDAAKRLWVAHVDACGPVPDGGLVLSP